MILSDRLKALREQENYSQSKLGELLNVRPNTVWRWENDKAIPDANTVIKIAEALKTSVAYLLGEIDTPSPIKQEIDNKNTKDAEADNRITSNKTASNGSLIYEWGGTHRIEIPDTPQNQIWFRELMTRVIQSNGISNS